MAPRKKKTPAQQAAMRRTSSREKVDLAASRRAMQTNYKPALNVVPKKPDPSGYDLFRQTMLKKKP